MKTGLSFYQNVRNFCVYQAIKSVPHSALTAKPAARYGPKASSLPTFLIIISETCITEPMIQPKTRPSRLSLRPRKRPIAVQSL